MKIELSKPYMFDGKEYKEITLDMEQINGRTLVDIGRQYAKEFSKDTEMVKAVDERYLLMIAESVSGLPTPFFYDLPAHEFIKVTNAVLGFLAGVDSTPKT